MSEQKVYRAIGLMSGTSLDGIDAALIETDGQNHIKPLGFSGTPYKEALRSRLRAVLGQEARDADLEHDLTQAHADILKDLGWEADIIGFHGQTIFHAPEQGISVQLGDGALLAAETGIDVVNDFRSADMQAGGQGAPFLPLYHQARLKTEALEAPVAVLNIGGVGNVTWIGEGEEDILAFDTGPGNALIDDFVQEKTGKPFDKDGRLAKGGKAERAVLEGLLSHDYFSRPPPKSLDRDAFSDIVANVKDMSDADGAAVLTAFTVLSIQKAAAFFPAPVSKVMVTGGGRHNRFMMESLEEALGVPVKPVEEMGWNGDALEAEGFAWLAVRSLLGLPLSVPSTTGVPGPQTGGRAHKAA